MGVGGRWELGVRSWGLGEDGNWELGVGGWGRKERAIVLDTYSELSTQHS
uniref:Uncharacterized protein n=1 Tax=Desertifilum tharense IPPAS B-1220 TaxID=1781255 RepID=A0ACD5GRZ6_9CYAN